MCLNPKPLAELSWVQRLAPASIMMRDSIVLCCMCCFAQYAGNFNQALAARLQIKWNLSTAFCPQTESDGYIERTHLTVEDVPRHLVAPSYDDWDQSLPLAQFTINNAWQESVQNKPFFLNHRPPAQDAFDFSFVAREGSLQTK